jgi:putative membrane protein
MEEKQQPAVPQEKSRKTWFIDFFKGLAIGLSMNVPGASGGTTALLVKIYDKMVNAVSNIFHKFKESFLYLLPIGLGVIIGFAATLYPMDLALKNIPFGISCVFAGLVLAGIPTLCKKVKRKPTWQAVAAFVLSCALVVGLCFVPGMGNADLTVIKAGTFFLALVMGIVSSFALVVPGVSGALLLFIFGFYTPIMGAISDLFKTHATIGADFAYICIFCLGVLVGFFGASKAMGYLLTKHEYPTYMGILGFILGSLYAIFHPFIVGVDSMGKFKNGLFPDILSQGWHLGLGIILLVISTAVFLYIFYLADKPKKEGLKENGTEEKELKPETKEETK